LPLLLPSKSTRSIDNEPIGWFVVLKIIPLLNGDDTTKKGRKLHFWFDAINEAGETVQIRSGRFDMHY
jgi:hypothetical protein